MPEPKRKRVVKVSQQARPENETAGTYRPQMSTMTGRRRKLTDGVMLDICDRFADGAKVSDLCSMYGVSPNVIYSICYWTPRKRDLQ